MNTQSDQNEKRITRYWYAAFIALPLAIALLLFNADPYERVQLNQVLELRATLAQQNAGADVVAWLDSKGGHNLTEAEWVSLQAVDAAQLHFMLTSSQLSPLLKQAMAAALEDHYVTQGEYQAYLAVASPALMAPALLTRFGY